MIDPRVYNAYISDSVYLLLAQSTLPKETNIANCRSRMDQIPRVIAAAKENLQHPARPLLETAINPKSYLQQDLPDYVFDCVALPPKAVVPGPETGKMPAKCKVIVGGARRPYLDELQAAARLAGVTLEMVVPNLIDLLGLGRAQRNGPLATGNQQSRGAGERAWGMEGDTARDNGRRPVCREGHRLQHGGV